MISPSCFQADRHHPSLEGRVKREAPVAMSAFLNAHRAITASMRDSDDSGHEAETGTGFGAPVLRTVFDAIDEFVMVRDASGRLTDVNDAFLTAFGGERGDWTGRWFAMAPGFGEDSAGRRYDVAMRTRTGEAWSAASRSSVA